MTASEQIHLLRTAALIVESRMLRWVFLWSANIIENLERKNTP